MAIDEHIEAVLNGNKAIRKIRIRNGGTRLDLSNADLRGKDLKGLNFGSVNLSGANLDFADLSGAELSGSDLSSASIMGANLQDTQLFLANLDDADLTDSVLDGANMTGARIDAVLNGTSMRKCCLNRVLVSKTIEKANTAGSFTEYQGIRNPGLSFWIKIPFGLIKLLLTNVDKGRERAKLPFLQTIRWMPQFYATLLLAPFSIFSWPLSGKLGRLTLLTKASYVVLTAVPLLAWLWPAVRAAVNDYNMEVVRSAKQANETADKLLVLGETLNSNIIPEKFHALILDLHQQINTVSTSLSEEIIRSPDLPASMVAIFFAALAVTIGHLVLEMFGPEIVRKLDQNNFVQAEIQEWSQSSVQHDKLKENFQYLKDTEEGDQDRYHQQLIQYFGRLIWLPNEIESISLISTEKQISIVSMAAARRYDIATRSGRIFSFLSSFMYFIGIVLISFVVFRQALSVIDQSGAF